jgi:predicted GTPase
MTLTEESAGRYDYDYRRLRRLDELRTRLLDYVDRPDLAETLSRARSVTADAPLRVVTVGETKRGKSTLVNTLVGRPLLSPVGTDVTTSCWLEIGYGERDEAEVLLADPHAFGEPRRVPCDIREVERFVALSDVSDPVLGVQVRINSPLLRDLVLIDTPGVGGLVAGHSRTTLAALRHADALLFVSDARQPILAPEINFLLEAVNRVPTVVVAVTKCDLNPQFEVVVAETQARIAEHPSLRGAPIFAVATPLAERAIDTEDRRTAVRLTELSGMAPLVAALTHHAAAGGASVRFANTSRVVSNTAQLLINRTLETIQQLAATTEQEGAIEANVARLNALLADRPRLTLLVQHHMARLRVEPLDAFDGAVGELRARYDSEAERGAAAQLTTLAPRMVADLTAAGVEILEMAAAQSTRLLGKLIEETGAQGVVADLPTRDPSALRLDLPSPQFSGQAKPVAAAGQSAGLFSTLVNLLAGSAAVVSVLTGPGVIAASIALAAGAGWWQVRGNDERERRAQLGAWVDIAAAQSRSTFEREMARRVLAVEQYVEGALPQLLEVKQAELRSLNAELAQLRRAGEQSVREALAQAQNRLAELRELADEVGTLAVAPRPGSGLR